MHPIAERLGGMTRRQMLGRGGVGLAALWSLMSGVAASGAVPHFAARARRVIYLFQSGAPSQMDLFDYKPKLNELRGVELPDSTSATGSGSPA